MAKIFEAAALRHDLHEIPELGLNLPKTCAYVTKKLEELGIEPHRCGKYGIVAEIRGEEPGPVLALRADMDALPFVQDGKPVCIHACGHDAHTSMLLAAASRMVGRVKKGTLKLLFQPGEETLDGALEMIENHAIDDVDIIIGAHIRPLQDLPAGKCCAAVNHSASCPTFVTVHGKSCHASRPHLGNSALYMGTAIVQAANAFWLDPRSAWSIKATQFHADQGAVNSVPDKCTIGFDMRASTNEDMDAAKAMIKRVAEHVSAAMGGTAEVRYGGFCPAAVYDDDVKEAISDVIREQLGEDALAPECGGGGEDFHHFKLHKPSIKAGYFGVGVAAAPGLHNATLHFDEKYLDMGVKVWLGLVDRYLGLKK